jgi:MoaA/NifB/PqqE/SkfB family radical SAM enzyme
LDLGVLMREDAELAARARRALVDPEAPFPTLSAKIKLTWRCNLRCCFCRQWRKRPEKRALGDNMSVDLVEEILEGLRARGLIKVHFSGGEVLLREDFPEIVRFARRLGLQVNLTTNGTLLDGDMARFLVDERVHAVTVSVDSSDRRTHDALRGGRGAWRGALRGVQRLAARRARKGRGPTIAVNTVITRHNLDGLPELHRLLTEAGVDRWLLLPVDTDESGLRPTAEQWRWLAARWDSWRPLMRRAPVPWNSEKSAARAGKGQYAGGFYGEHPCFAPWFNLFVDADGSAYPCCCGKGSMRPYGSVLESPVGELLDGSRRRELCCSMAAGHALPVCETCDDYLEENRIFAEVCEKEEA